MAKTHEIVKVGREFYAQGLTRDEGLAKYFPADLTLPGEMLFVRGNGDVDRPQTYADLYAACYDAHQCFEGWQDDDVLAYNGVVFARIESFHVIAQSSDLLPDKAAFKATKL